MKLINKLTSGLALRVKMWLAERRVIVLAEFIDKEKNIYRVYCPKCRTWHTVHLSGLSENKQFHLPCGEVQ